MHSQTLEFLRNNIGKNDFEESERDTEERVKRHKSEEYDDDDSVDEVDVIIESDNEMTDDERRAAFQAYYKREMARQKMLMTSNHVTGEKADFNSHVVVDSNEDEDINVMWEDG